MSPAIYALFVTNGGKASDDLVDAGFECWHFTFKKFCPGAQWEMRSIGGKDRMAIRAASEIRAPLYPGYVFARIPAERFGEALDMPRVIDVVRGAGDMPKPMPSDLIDALVRETLCCAHDEEVPAPTKPSRYPNSYAVIPKNRARSRKRRRSSAQRMRKWLDAEAQTLPRAA